MRTRSMLRAVVAGAALAAAAVPASAEPVDIDLCVADVDCVSLYADTANGLDLDVDAAVCAPEGLVAACVPAVVSRQSSPPPPSGRVYRVECGSDGWQSTIQATVTAMPSGGVPVTRVRGTCEILSNGTPYASVEADGPGPVETGVRSVGHVVGPIGWCISVQAWWADGHTEGYASAGRECRRDET